MASDGDNDNVVQFRRETVFQTERPPPAPETGQIQDFSELGATAPVPEARAVVVDQLLTLAGAIARGENGEVDRIVLIQFNDKGTRTIALGRPITVREMVGEFEMQKFVTLRRSETV